MVQTCLIFFICKFCGSKVLFISVVSPPSSLSSLQSLAAGCTLAAAVRAQAPNLTPSLANHYRDDLVNHVRGWQADAQEKQVCFFVITLIKKQKVSS